MKQRLLSIVLAVCMLLSVLPFTVFAADVTEIRIGSKGIPEKATGDGYSFSFDTQSHTYVLTLQEGYTFRLTGDSLSDVNVTNYGTVLSGSFMGVCFFKNYGTISGGNVGCDWAYNYGKITDGNFSVKFGLDNDGSITGGYFFCDIINKSNGTVSDTVNEKRHTFETVSLGNERVSVTKNGFGIGDVILAGETYNLTHTAKPTGLYLLGKNDPIPTAPYSVSSDFRPIFGGLSFDFDAPDKDVTLYAVFYDELLTIDGIGDGTPFVFYKGEKARAFQFSLFAAPTDINDFVWSAEGLPAGLELTEDDNYNIAVITGTPTALSDTSDAKIMVSATDDNKKKYYGELAIRVRVEEPYVDIEPLVKNTECSIPMAKAATADDVNTWLNEKWLPSLLQGKRLPEGYDISDFIVRASENANPAFTAATAGNLSTPNGTNGSYYFEVGTYYDMNGEPFFELVAESICTITAAPYVHEHAWSANWSSDNTAHWHECTICDDKKDYKKHEYGKADALGVRTCTACNYSETVSVGIHDDGGSWAATFTPTGDSRLSPGTAMKAQDYTPTARDLQVALEAIDINAEKREASAEYIVEERDIIIKDLMKIGKENYWMGDHYDQGEINGVIIHMIEQDGVKTINAVSLKNDNKWYVITDTDGSVSVRARDTSDSLIAKYELITINGVPYFISYTFTEDNITEYNIIYTTDSKLAGVLVKDNYGPVGVFNRGCDPEALKASRALCEYFTDKDGALFAIRSVFSQDLSLQKNDAPIKLTGDMQIAFKPKLPVSKDTTFVGLHRTETGYETVKAEVIDGKVIAEFSDTDQSPFMIFAVERVWQPEQSGTQNPGENPRTDADSNMALWLALMFVSAGTVVTPGIKSKRKKAVR